MKDEKIKKERLARGKVTKIFLSLLAAGGIMTLAVIAPNVVQLLAEATGRPKNFYRPRYIETVIDRLIKKKLLERKKAENGQIFLKLTERGEKEYSKYQLKELTIRKPKKWDSKWRVIIFDIKEYRRRDRDCLRLELINLGFVRLQNSVWVYPYECEELIMLLKTSFELGRSLLYLTVEKLEGDNWLRDRFGLK